MKRVLAFLAILTVFPLAAPAQELELNEIQTALDASETVTVPKPGQWLEYVVAFPADPLEEMIRRQLDRSGQTSGTSLEQLRPDGTLPPTWTSMPVRFEILAEHDDGYTVRMTAGDKVITTTLPAGEIAPAAFPPGAELIDERSEIHRVDSQIWPVTAIRMRHETGVYVRWTHPEMPFGLARYASPDADIILVGTGDSPAPAFPLEGIRIRPEPGRAIELDGAGP